MLTPIRGRLLAAWARARIGQELGGPRAEPPEAPTPAPGQPPWTERPTATFVSLHWPDGELQGCIGTLEARRPLVVDVAANALAAAFDDARGRRFDLAELDDLAIEVSILSPLERLAVGSEADALRAIRPGVDGLLLKHRGQRGTLLPSVWAELPEPRGFLAMLRRKAGLPPDYWSDDLELWRYTTEVATDRPGGPR